MVDFVKFKKQDDEDKPQKTSKRKINFKGIFFIFLFFFILSMIISSITYSLTPKIAIVPIYGEITSQKASSFYSDTTSSREIANTLKTLKEDSSIKAILIDINSPGGSPVASEEISRAIEDVKKEKPVYAVIEDTGASGAYWAGVSADKLYASKLSITGSIGVTSVGFGFEDFIKKYNITYRQETAGEYKDMGSSFRAPTEEENKMMQKLLDDLHLEFKKHIAESRNMTLEELAPYAEGQVFLGEEAVEIGLVDGIGYYDTTIAELKNLTNSPNAIVVNYGPTESLSDILGVNSLFKLPSTQSSIMLK